MDPLAAGYMFWAKTHPPARFELTGSGLQTVSLADFAKDDPSGDVEPGGPYGEPDLIEAIATLRGVTPDRVLPVPGTSTANFVALACVARPGGRVLIETPGYDPIPRAARLLGLEVAFFERIPQRRYAPDLDAIERGLVSGARAVFLTNLHNPSGLACPEPALRELARPTGDCGAMLIIDEVYLDYARHNTGVKPLRGVQLGQHVITTDSLTKVYGLGPLRAGWLIAAPQILERARHAVDLIHVVNPVVSARLARCALAHLDVLAERCRTTHDAGYSIFNRWHDSRNDVRVYGHDGGLFVWLGLPAGIGASALTQVLTAEFETNVVPGTFFGSEDHVRISLAVSPDDLRQGLDRVGAALDRLAL